VVVDSARLNAAALTALGAMGVVRPSPTAAQVVLGPIADQVAGDLRTRLGTVAPAVQSHRSLTGPTLSALDPQPLLELLGGSTNVKSVTAAAGRLLICVSQPPDIADARWESAGVRDLGYSAEGTLHLLVGPSAESTGRALSALLRA
jgi:PTS system N-acetylglucosamine-specific IIC component